MEAIIVAAGQGNRLMPITNDKPKCLLEIKGKTILQRQLETFTTCGINDIVVVRGYEGQRINYQGIRYIENTNYKNNNILRSLFYAEGWMDNGFLFSYSDIIFDKSILEKLLQSKADISLIVDVDWIGHYERRYQHPVDEAELAEVEQDRMTKIGKKICAPDEAYGEFIGLAKFTEKGAAVLKGNYRRAVNQYQNRPFQRAVSLEKAYLTDMIQELIDKGYIISNVDIRGGWIEIDTSEDLEKARKLFV